MGGAQSFGFSKHDALEAFLHATKMRNMP